MEDRAGKPLAVVGSSSLIKRNAVSDAFSGYEVKTVPEFESAVPPQPVGKQETEKGARYRAFVAKKIIPTANIWIGIENGMWQDDKDNTWVDGACIVILVCGKDGNHSEAVIWSDVIEIPENYPKGPNGEWSIDKDPHRIITNGKRPRAQFLSDALTAWKNNVVLEF
eukprot:TRINITY_DN21829_c0_g1_i1.p1 TRINITY_DN21829_c0_g1~~TRINITY_DN21829_c0_g1_i1.p1  ORF type:complete len:167 (+),score=36.33 TRINITY_DN21829_c0_g1_i1:49-549(+)